MSNKFKESIHQEFERFMRDEMDDNEKNITKTQQDLRILLKESLNC